MSEPAQPCVLVVCDPGRVGELVGPLGPEAPPLPIGPVTVIATSGGDDTIDEFAERKPHVVIVTATLAEGDAATLIESLRGMVPRAHVVVIVVGDEQGPIRTMIDAFDLQPDRFVTSPVAPNAIRYAVTGGVEAARLARGPDANLSPRRTFPGAGPATPHTPAPPVEAAPPPVATTPGTGAVRASGPISSGVPTSTEGTEVSESYVISSAPVPRTTGTLTVVADDASRTAMRARWEHLADSMVDEAAFGEGAFGDAGEMSAGSGSEGGSEAAPLPPPIIIRPRQRNSEPSIAPVAPEAWKPGTTSELRGNVEAWAEAAPLREPTFIMNEHAPAPSPPTVGALGVPAVAPPTAADTSTSSWSPPPPLADLVRTPERRDDHETDDELPEGDDDELAGLDDFDDPLVLGDMSAGRRHGLSRLGGSPNVRASTRMSGRLEVVDSTIGAEDPSASLVTPPPTPPRASDPIGMPFAEPDRPLTIDPSASSGPPAEGRDFARQLRAKMSMMAQRLFQGGEAKANDLGPRHDASTEFDLAALGEEPQIGGGVTEIESRPSSRPGSVETPLTSPGTWNTQVRERGLPDSGELARGVSDAAMLLAKMFATGATGRITFRRDETEKVVFLDQGRPVFASSSDIPDRMGELLVREGKITASQYERCQAVVAESGRRMGEILVDFGYLKRRELLPAVRRHVEDIVYSLFGWDRGTYEMTTDETPSTERIRLSRHAASLILEGIRRKLDRTSLEKLIGGAATVIEVPDRERLGGVLNLGDLAPEERAALAAFDAQADLAQVARVAGIDIADVLPLAWGLVVLGLATARRADVEAPDESTALVGETDLAIDRERVRARWQLVTEADYFALLGVRRDATAFEIRRAYQSARRDFAADCFPNDLRRELARELDDIANVLDEAFRVLRDDRLRVTYLANLYD